jgi:fucose permease
MTEVRGLSATEYGALQAIYYWAVMATEVPSGIVADRLGRKWTLALGALVNGVGCWTFAVSYDFGVFAVGEVLFALGTALIRSPRRSAKPSTRARRVRGRCSGWP